MTQRLILRHGDCVEVLKGYDDGSIGAFCCDPPYDLTAVSRGGSARQAGTGPFGRHELDTKNPRGGFMGKAWDGTGIAFSADLWDEVYRVLQPGGIIKAFSGTRTFHRMASAMAEAGFVDMSVSCWVYGSGFPKSKNIGLFLDKKANAIGNRGRAIPTASLHLPGKGKYRSGGNKLTSNAVPPYEPRTEAAQQWDGWGTALKPAWEPVVVGRKPE